MVLDGYDFEKEGRNGFHTLSDICHSVVDGGGSMTDLDRGRELAMQVQPFRLSPKDEHHMREYFTCRCPEPDPPGFVHLVPIDCTPLKRGETLDRWRERTGMAKYYRSLLESA